MALVTTPCPALSAEAQFIPNLDVVRADHPLHARAAAAALSELGRARQGGHVIASSTAPRGGGAGWSTATVLAVIRATASAFNHQFAPEDESRLALDVEGAVDPLAFPASPPRIWASRSAETLGLLPPLPRLHVVGAFDGPGAATDPADLDFPDIGDLFDRFRGACARGDAAAVGAAATVSAELNQDRNPKPSWRAVKAAAADTSALGVSVAHTGSAVALLFEPTARAAAKRAATALSAAGLTRPVAFDLVG